MPASDTGAKIATAMVGPVPGSLFIAAAGKVGAIVMIGDDGSKLASDVGQAGLDCFAYVSGRRLWATARRRSSPGRRRVGRLGHLIAGRKQTSQTATLERPDLCRAPAFAQPIVANMPAILSGTVLMSPALPRISSNLPVTNAVLAAKAAQAASAGTVAPPPSISDLLDLEHDLYLDPVGTLRRHFKVYVLPVFIGAGGALLGTPQRDCVPVRLCIPSGSAAGKTLGALASGVDQYFATRDNVPASMFAVGNGGGGHIRAELPASHRDAGRKEHRS